MENFYHKIEKINRSFPKIARIYLNKRMIDPAGPSFLTLDFIGKV